MTHADVRPDPARLLFPALRWSDGAGSERLEQEAAEALALGVGGFILFGGEAGAVEALTRRLRSDSSHRLLLGADLERGAGQQFEGCTALPPAWALASLDDLEVLWRAAEITAREARAVGVDWVYAPVADLGNEPKNPIVATRAFGSDPEAVGRAVVAWSLGCLAGGGIPCAKHFPGHGRTLSDSHLEMPVVEDALEALARDLVPFAAASAAHVPSVMSAHVAYPALDPSGTPATRSRRILGDLLRRRLGFRGVVVSDALIMEGAAGDVGEAEAAIEAVRAGVDALLYPRELDALAGALRSAAPDVLDPGRIGEAVGRLEAMAELVPEPLPAATGGSPTPVWGREEDRRWARDVALRTVRVLREPEGPLSWPYTLVTVDDDLGGPYGTPDRSTFVSTLRGLGVEVEEAGEELPEAPGPRLVAVYADVRGWKGRVGLSGAARERLARVLGAPDPALVVLFSHPWNAVEVPPPVPLLCAWGGEPLMQEAAARAVARLPSG